MVVVVVVLMASYCLVLLLLFVCCSCPSSCCCSCPTEGACEVDKGRAVIVHGGGRSWGVACGGEGSLLVLVVAR